MDIRSSQKARQSKVVQQRQKVCPYTLYLYYVFSQLRKISLVNVFVSDMAKSREEVTKLEKYRELAAHQIFRICCKVFENKVHKPIAISKNLEDESIFKRSRN